MSLELSYLAEVVPSYFAVIVAVPSLTAVISPVIESTLTTASSLDSYVGFPISAPSSAVKVAVT